MKLTTLESWSELNEPCFSICKSGKEILQTVRQSNDEPPASQLALDNVNDICEKVNNYNALKSENEQLKQALQMFHDAFIHRDGETKKNKVKTDMIGLCDEMKDALNNSRQLLDYGAKQL